MLYLFASCGFSGIKEVCTVSQCQQHKFYLESLNTADKRHCSCSTPPEEGAVAELSKYMSLALQMLQIVLLESVLLKLSHILDTFCLFA